MGLTGHQQPTKNIHGLSSNFLERNNTISGVTRVLARTQNKNLPSKKIPLISRHLTLPIMTTICPAPPIPNRLSTFRKNIYFHFYNTYCIFQVIGAPKHCIPLPNTSSQYVPVPHHHPFPAWIPKTPPTSIETSPSSKNCCLIQIKVYCRQYTITRAVSVVGDLNS